MAPAAAETAPALPDIAVGALPATPIMRWLLERGGPIERFNQAMLLQVPAGLREDHLVAALQALLDHHDALRLRLVGAADGRREWSLEIAPPGARARRGAACAGSMSAGSMRLRCAPRSASRRKRPSCGWRRPTGVMVQAVWFDAGGSGRAGCC